MGFTPSSKHGQTSSELEMFPPRDGYTGNSFAASRAVTSFAASAFGDGFVLGLGLFVTVLKLPGRR